MKKTIFFSVFLSFMISSCSKPNVEGVHIRLKNVSIVDYDNVVINTSGGENDYGALLSNDMTEYFQFERAYSYAQVNLSINGEFFVLQPIDYVGETPLDDGYYRYEIGVENFDSKTLFIELKEE